eukprot:3195745-Amphidinium_carterae.1
MFTEWKCAVPPALWRCLSLSLLLAWCPRCAAKYGNYHEFDSEPADCAREPPSPSPPPPNFVT